jgi:hypothetical protein
MPTAQARLRAVSPWRNGALSPSPASASTRRNAHCDQAIDLRGTRRGRATEPVGVTRSLPKTPAASIRGSVDASDQGRPAARERGLAHSSPNPSIVAELLAMVRCSWEMFVARGRNWAKPRS